MHTNLSSTNSESLHFIASNYGRTRNHVSAYDALIPCNPAPGMVDMDFAFVVATPAKPSPYKKYTANKSCANSAH
jgi:hypothetical protein